MLKNKTGGVVEYAEVRLPRMPDRQIRRGALIHVPGISTVHGEGL